MNGAMAKLDQCLNMDDMRALAKRRAHKMVFDYIDGGADDEWTLKQNSRAFENYSLHYKVLAGVGQPDLTLSLPGAQANVPFILAPSAGNRLFHKAGERAVAKAAQKIGAIYCLSTLSSFSIEAIGQQIATPKWFQLYVWKDRGLVRDMIARAKAAGFSALILTADLPTHGNRERDPKNGFTIPPSMGVRQILEALKRPAWTWDYLTSEPVRFANLMDKGPAQSLAQFVHDQLDQSFTWDDAEFILSEWNGPSYVKGLVRADDGVKAIKSGFEGIFISNHGGRQLDGAPAPIGLVETMRDRLGDDITLIVDGGIRRATDMLKAKALGADAVSFARPYLYGLAAAGEAGVSRALELFYSALLRDMVLLGASSWQGIDGRFVGKKKT